MATRIKTFVVVVLLWGLGCAAATTLRAAGPRVLPSGKRPKDRRLLPLKDLNGYFPFAPPASKREWNRRRANLRRQLQVAVGLWPMPEKTPLRPRIHGRIDQGDYTVEKVYFESFPGFFVTGNLYRPQGRPARQRKRPGVLCPHGHWSNGRFYDLGEAGVKAQIAKGGEKFPQGGRSHLQARCVQIARMGCVAFHYDMIGYADSIQISQRLAHGFANQREKMNSPTQWGLFSPQAESRLQSVMGLQTWNSIRALDFLLSLPEVDPQRIAVTGASGGGTQTFMLCALDPRPAVSVPAVMVSTAMQGGCTCENACLLRTIAGNVEFAALFAPKPQALTAADDWTREMETKGFPELQTHYRLLGAADNVALNAPLQFKHNYNYVNRQFLYHWLNRHFRLGFKTPIQERDYPRLTRQQLTVWDGDRHPRPSSKEAFEMQLLAHWNRDAQRQIAAARPKDPKSARAYRELVGGAIDALIGRRLPPPAEIDYEQTQKSEQGGVVTILGLLRNLPHGEELPIVFLYPKAWEKRVVIWIDAEGKQGLFANSGKPKPAVQKLLDEGVAVAGVDLLFQGEFAPKGAPTRTRRVANPREAAAYTFGYNPTLLARRVHDVLTTVSFIRNHETQPEQVDLVAFGSAAAPIAIAARAQARDAITRLAVDTGGFRFAAVRDLHSPQFLPGGAKYDDLPGMLAVAAPAPLWIAGEGKEGPAVVQAAYGATGGKWTAATAPAREKAIAWLLEKEQASKPK